METDDDRGGAPRPRPGWHLMALGGGIAVLVLAISFGIGALLGGGGSSMADDDGADKHEGHGTGPVEFVPLPEDQQAILDQEWDRARAIALRYPTLGDALDDGFEIAQGNPENGVHAVRWDRMDGSFAIDEPEQLLFRSEEDDAPVMALSYQVVTESSTPPEGFTSANDQWHEHRGVCLDDARRVEGMEISATECATLGGQQGNADGWMLHVWILPGWDNPDGVYAATNPELRIDG